MTKKPFIHLHFHTAYSLLDSTCKIDDCMERAHELEMPALAMTDHGVLHGTIEFYKKAHAKGIKPIIGCEVYVATNSRHERIVQKGQGYANHLVLLAENEIGYANLVRLVSLGHLEGFYYKPRIDLDLLDKHHDGLIALSACLKGKVAQNILKSDLDAASKVACEYSDIFGPDNFYLEMMDHGMQEQLTVNRGMLEVAKRTGLPLVATNDVHYIKKEHAAAHDLMLCLQTQTVMSDPKRMRYAAKSLYMKSAEEMWDSFGDTPDSLYNTVAIAERCNVDLHLEEKLHFPVYDVPDGFTQKEFLRHIANKGLKNRYEVDAEAPPTEDRDKTIIERLNYELDVIEKTAFVNYFLVVSDFVRFARDNDIPVGPGRGSGAGSLVAYVLGITGVDPLSYDLIFERFLNPERVSPPDFDIDFCQTRRNEVIEYVKDKYGREHVAQIITFGSLGAKTVIRDIGRVLEIPFADCDRLAKYIPDDPNMTLKKALDQSPDFSKAVKKEEFAKRIMEYAKVLEGLPRNCGIHAAGVVIGDKPLLEILPLCRDKEKQPVTQFEMKPLEATGLLKMDFLGLKTLTVIQETIDNVKMSQNIIIDIDKIPLDDPETFALLNRADTIGVFQVESRGMRDLLRRIGLERLEDLMAMIALFRPGPMNMLDDYVNRKHGKVKIKYDHPLLEPILNETYGVMLYQEQVQQAANVLAGFTYGQGDILRRAMGKKILSEMTAQRERFVDGCSKVNNIPAKQAEKIFDNIERFAGYGFNKSHTAGYGIISYQTAYLKAHYPVEFMAALLSIEIGNTDKIPVLIAEAQNMEIEILPPDVNESQVRFSPSNGAIRFGLAGVKNVGTAVVKAIVDKRDANKPFKGLVDFCARMDTQVVNKKVLESLIRCGAFDFSNVSRGRMFNGIEFAVGRATSSQRDKQKGQATLFDLLDPQSADNNDNDLPDAKAWPEHEMLSAEKELLGFYISGHPLQQYEWSLKHFSLTDIKSLYDLPTKTETRVGGLISQLSKRITKKSQRQMATFRLEGLEEAVDVVVFPDAFEACAAVLVEEQPVMICGSLEVGDETKIKAVEIYSLAEVPSLFAKTISLHINTTNLKGDLLSKVQEVLTNHPGPTSMMICLQFPGGEKVFINSSKKYNVLANDRLVNELNHILGEDSVYIESIQQPLLKKQITRNRATYSA